ncbi:MAG: GTPase HflX [Halobaculum sp.]
MQIGDRVDGGRAIVAARRQDAEPDTEEIERLAAAAGFEVVETVTQQRQEDQTYNLGAGKAETLAERAAETAVDAVIFDGELSPGQYGDLRGLLPAETRLVDRYRLVLEIFAEGAGDERAEKQVQLATLEYEFPRLRQTAELQSMSSFTEKGSPVYDVADRIDRLRSELASMSDDAARRRERRREEGFELVAVAGYTNAGKSTLLHRLADDLSLSDANTAHDDESVTANTEDRLFETLETTTRRATFDGRRLLLTDTVGLIDDLPHELVASFSTTLDEIADGDAVLAVIDAAAEPARFRQRAQVTLDVLAGEAATERVVPVLNKVDLIEESTLAARRETIRELAPEARDPVAISALAGSGLDTLRERLLDTLPAAELALDLPNTGATQQFLSWLHDHGSVTTNYDGSRVTVDFAAQPSLVDEARRRATDLADDDPVVEASTPGETAATDDAETSP